MRVLAFGFVLSMIAVVMLVLPASAQIVQSGGITVDLSQMEKGKPGVQVAGTDDEMITNAGFETGNFTPWYHDGAWQISTTTPHMGTYCAYDIGNHWLRQDFAPTPASSIISATLWCMQPDEAIAAVDFYYTDGSYDEDIIWPASFWQVYDVTSFIDPTKTVNGIRVWGYSGGGSLPDETFYDDFSIQTSGGGTPDLTVDLTYVSGSPVPASGGTLTYGLFAENVGTTPANFDGWLEVSYQAGDPVTVAQRAFTNFMPGWTINRPSMIFPVPGTYPAGSYTFGCNLGDYAVTIYAGDTFPFTKSGSADGSSFVPFVPDGIENPFDQIVENDANPGQFELIGNYPNPFNPSTVLSYNLQDAGNITLAVYDISGSEVARLVDGYRNAGHHEVTFDASHLSSGIYLYRLTTGELSAIGKMVLVK